MGEEMNASPVEYTLPLAPLQEGVLFHALYEPESRDLYLTQTVVKLLGTLDPVRLERAVAQVLSRHANLRASFRYRKSGEPVQVVRRDPEPVWAIVPAPADGGFERAIEEDWGRGI